MTAPKTTAGGVDVLRTLNAFADFEDCSGESGTPWRRARADELRESRDAIAELIEAAGDAQCDCTVRERDSGHKLECWMPRLRAALAAVAPKDGAL